MKCNCLVEINSIQFNSKNSIQFNSINLDVWGSAPNSDAYQSSREDQGLGGDS